MLELEGKRALVTGGTRGIGKAISVALAKKGVQLVLNFLRNVEAAEKTASEIERITGKLPTLVKGNVAEPEKVEVIAETIKEKLGGLDILISNAASGVLRPFHKIELKHFRWTLDINAFGFLNVVKTLLPLMGRRAKVVAISSLGAVRAIPNYSVVGASKGALESLVRHIAYELAPRGINVNAVVSGVVETEALKFFPNRDELLAEARRRTPIGRLVEPDDVAKVVLLLVSDLSDMITGQTIVVDGGYSILA